MRAGRAHGGDLRPAMGRPTLPDGASGAEPFKCQRSFTLAPKPSL